MQFALFLGVLAVTNISDEAQLPDKDVPWILVVLLSGSCILLDILVKGKAKTLEYKHYNLCNIFNRMQFSPFA